MTEAKSSDTAEISAWEAYHTGEPNVPQPLLFNETVGIILGSLYESIPIPDPDVTGIKNFGSIAQVDEWKAHFLKECVNWLVAEGLVRRMGADSPQGVDSYVLSAKGLALLQQPLGELRVDGADTAGGALAKLKGQIANAATSASVNQIVQAIFRLLGL